VFDQPTQCVVGRADDCDIQLPPDFAHADVSRHHCLLRIEPPVVHVRDLGSKNGTFVNGENIGQRQLNQNIEEADLRAFRERDAKDGDEIRLGGTVFRVGVIEPKHALQHA
jgi:pSer/pThr/pTyr-binding forkhead associated (FHA) protein